MSLWMGRPRWLGICIAEAHLSERRPCSSLADHCEHANQSKTMVPMHVCDEDIRDRQWVDASHHKLAIGRFAAVDQ